MKHKTPQRILVATDFSENAEVALKWAITLAKAHGASLGIMHVAKVTATSSLPLTIQEQIRHNLETLKNRVSDMGIATTTTWNSGRPWELVSAEAEQYDVLVIGARGNTPFLNLSLGSTADRILRTSPIPVLTIHHDDAAPEQLPRHILVPTDFSATARQSLDVAIALFGGQSPEPLTVTLLHAWQPLVEYGDLYSAMPVAVSVHVTPEEQSQEILAQLAADVQSETVTVNPVIRQGYPVKVIEEEAAECGADLVAMGTHGHSGLARTLLGSVAERVVHRVVCPVLSVAQAARGSQTDHCVAVTTGAEG